MYLSKSQWAFSGASRSDRKGWECDPLLSSDVFHNGERKSVYKVSRRSPHFYLKQVISWSWSVCSFLRSFLNALMQDTWAPLTPKDQSCGNFCDCRKHTGSKKTFPTGSGDWREKGKDGGEDGGEDGGHHGGGELWRDGLNFLKSKTE